MLIQDILKPNVVTIEPDASVEDAFQLLMQHNIHHLVVVEGKQIQGVISSSDIDIASLQPQELKHIQVKQCMSRKVVCVPPETSLKQAAQLMQKHHFECLPICNEHELVGIVTVEDLLDVFCKSIEQLDLEEADWCAVKKPSVRWPIHPLG